MSAGRVFGGLIALFGGVFILYRNFDNINVLTLGFEDLTINWIVQLLIGIIALAGGILGLASKKGGGALTLIAGIMAFLVFLLGSIISSAELLVWFYPYSGLDRLLGWGIFVMTGTGFYWVISFEGFLIFLGALLILNTRDEKYK